MSKHMHPGLINSSQGIFFTVSALFISYVLAQPFEGYNRTIAWVAIFAYALLFYFIWMLLRQFSNTNHLIAYFIVAMIIFPLVMGAVLNLIFGVLHEGTAPVFYGPGRIIKTVVEVKLYPALFIQYGLLVFISSSVISLLFENLYEKVVKNMLPKRLAGKLNKIDRSLDQTAVEASDSLFLISNKGFVLSIAALFIHSAFLILLLKA